MLSRSNNSQTDPAMLEKAKKVCSYITEVWKKIEQKKIEDVAEDGEKLKKCIQYFSINIKYLPQYSDIVMYMSRSVLILVESKNLILDVKYFAKLIITCCQIIILQTDEEVIRESCIVTKEILQAVHRDSLDQIVRKYSASLSFLMKRVGRVKTHLTQALILEVIFKLTLKSEKNRNDAMKNQKFGKHVDPKAIKQLRSYFKVIDHEDIENTSRSFLSLLNNYINPKSGIFSCQGCVCRVNDVLFNEGDIVFIDFNSRVKSVAFSTETRNICSALSETNIHYSKSVNTAYFEVTFEKIELLSVSNEEIEIELTVHHLMYKQEMNLALQEIDHVATISFVLVDKDDMLKNFVQFHKLFLEPKVLEDVMSENESMISFRTDVSFVSRTGDDFLDDTTAHEIDETPKPLENIKEIQHDCPEQINEVYDDEYLHQDESPETEESPKPLENIKETEDDCLEQTNEVYADENLHQNETPEVVTLTKVQKPFIESTPGEIAQKEISKPLPWWSKHIPANSKLLNLPPLNKGVMGTERNIILDIVEKQQKEKNVKEKKDILKKIQAEIKGAKAAPKKARAKSILKKPRRAIDYSNEEMDSDDDLPIKPPQKLEVDSDVSHDSIYEYLTCASIKTDNEISVRDSLKGSKGDIEEETSFSMKRKSIPKRKKNTHLDKEGSEDTPVSSRKQTSFNTEKVEHTHCEDSKAAGSSHRNQTDAEKIQHEQSFEIVRKKRQRRSQVNIDVEEVETYVNGYNQAPKKRRCNPNEAYDERLRHNETPVTVKEEKKNKEGLTIYELECIDDDNEKLPPYKAYADKNRRKKKKNDQVYPNHYDYWQSSAEDPAVFEVYCQSDTSLEEMENRIKLKREQQVKEKKLEKRKLKQKETRKKRKEEEAKKIVKVASRANPRKMLPPYNLPPSKLFSFYERRNTPEDGETEGNENQDANVEKSNHPISASSTIPGPSNREQTVDDQNIDATQAESNLKTFFKNKSVQRSTNDSNNGSGAANELDTNDKSAKLKNKSVTSTGKSKNTSLKGNTTNIKRNSIGKSSGKVTKSAVTDNQEIQTPLRRSKRLNLLPSIDKPEMSQNELPSIECYSNLPSEEKENLVDSFAKNKKTGPSKSSFKEPVEVPKETEMSQHSPVKYHNNEQKKLDQNKSNKRRSEYYDFCEGNLSSIEKELPAKKRKSDYDDFCQAAPEKPEQKEDPKPVEKIVVKLAKQNTNNENSIDISSFDYGKFCKGLPARNEPIPKEDPKQAEIADNPTQQKSNDKENPPSRPCLFKYDRNAIYKATDLDEYECKFLLKLGTHVAALVPSHMLN